MAQVDRLLTYTLNATITDVSSAGQVYIPVPDGFGGDIVEIRSALNGAISGANAVLTAKIGGTAVTGGVITIANASSAAGDVDVCRPSGANTVADGGSVEIETNGASTGSVSVFLTVVVRR